MESSSLKKKISIAILMLLILLIIILLMLKGCQKKEYEIEFDTNGGNKISEVKVKENEKITKPKTPKKEGYEFVGWYYNDKLFDFDTKISENIKLEAKWKKIVKEVETVSLDKTTLGMNVGDHAELKATILPSDAEDQSLTWTSSDESIVVVDKNGKIKALKDGKATIVAVSKNGKKAECNVTVTKKETTTTKKEATKSSESKKTTSKSTTTKNSTSKNTTQKTPSTQKPSTPTKPTTPTKPAQDKYVIILKKIEQAGTNANMQYQIMGVTKNGTSFSGYTEFTYNGYTYRNVTKTIYASRVSGTTATIKLSDGSSVSATVSIQ